MFMGAWTTITAGILLKNFLLRGYERIAPENVKV